MYWQAVTYLRFYILSCFSAFLCAENNNKECHDTPSHPISAEKLLVQTLLKNYERTGIGGRPVVNMSQTVQVEFSLGLVQMELDEKYKVLRMSMWSRYKWRDDYLRWSPADYGGLVKTRLSTDLIWTPDIMLYNSADPDKRMRDVLAIVKYDGSVLWIPHQIFASSCSIDVTQFPFDRQKCHMWFGSWTHTANELDIVLGYPDGIDLTTFKSDYKESSDWDVERSSAIKQVVPQANDTERSYAVLKFQMDMRRKVVFSTYILTMPCVFLACLTLVVFWLPPDRPDRTALAMSIFASFLVLLLILVESAPPTASSVPTLGVYYCFNMVIIMLSVFLSSLVVNLCRSGETGRTVPRWLSKLMLRWLAKVFLMKKSLYKYGAPANLMPESSREMANGSADRKSVEDMRTVGHNKTSKDYERHYRTVVQSREASRLMLDMRPSLHGITTSLIDKSYLDCCHLDVIREWRDVAFVTDRLFFVIYIILIVTSLILLFPRER